MEQELEYRGVRLVIGSEQGGGRAWTIYPPDAEPEGGMAHIRGTRGSFKEAVMAGREAIDARLADGADAAGTGAGPNSKAAAVSA